MGGQAHLGSGRKINRYVGSGRKINQLVVFDLQDGGSGIVVVYSVPIVRYNGEQP